MSDKKLCIIFTRKDFGIMDPKNGVFYGPDVPRVAEKTGFMGTPVFHNAADILLNDSECPQDITQEDVNKIWVEAQKAKPGLKGRALANAVVDEIRGASKAKPAAKSGGKADDGKAADAGDGKAADKK